MTSQQPVKAPQPIHIVLPPRRSRVRRVGCTVLVILWFALLLTPCFCFALASQGEIAIRLGDMPGQSLRIWLLNESQQRGIGISSPSIVMREGQTCVQSEVSFFLWSGSAEGATFCECYSQSSGVNSWELSSSNGGSC